MDFYLQQLDLTDSGLRTWLRSGQIMTIGSSRRADVCLPGDASLPPLCAHLEARENDCVLTDISPARSVVTVNGSLTSVAVLESGDSIGVGAARFRIDWEVARPPAAEPPAVLRRLREEAFGSGIRRWSPTPDSDWPLASLLEQAAGTHSPMLLVNGRAGGEQVPDWVLAEDDHFSHAPAEIRREHSLHVIHGRSLEDLWKIYSPLDSAGAAIWALHAGDAETTLAEAKLYLAWFARPSILELNLQRGSEAFLDGLFKPFTGFCFRAPAGKEWVLYAKPGIGWADFGFTEPPVAN